MKQTVTKSMFTDAFQQMGRGEQFSYEGLSALYDYFSEMEDGTGEEMELDVIAICCDYTEYANIQEYNEAYGEEYENYSEVERYTEVIPVSGESFIIQNY